MSSATRKKTGSGAAGRAARPEATETTAVDTPPPMVTLTGGYQVPERFTVQMVRRLRGTSIWCQVSVEMVSGRPHVRSLAIARPAGAPPLSPADLARAGDLTELVDYAVREEARRHAPPLVWTSAEPPAEVPLGELMDWTAGKLGEQEAEALTAAKTARHRGRVTHADLVRVLDLYHRNGVPAIMEDFGVAERQARRLLARARKEASSEQQR
jgi:hypothetical protein